MARKSRKQSNNIDYNRKPSLIQAAAYVRLSSEDRTTKGNSIETQKRIISNYIDEHPNFELHDIYVDENVSGTTFERPSFQRLLQDIESGKINCLIVKDLSRLGRNVIDTGYYVEQVFPKFELRLISISDNFDSTTYKGDISLPLRNLANEAYSLDISRKRRSQARQDMKDGVFTGGRPPYGYVKSADNRIKLVVDESASVVVKQIFAWAVDGLSVYDIARRLNAAKTPSPSAHKNTSAATDAKQAASSGRWYARTIENMLKNAIYTGHLVQGKTKSVNFQRQPAPVDEWTLYAMRTNQ